MGILKSQLVNTGFADAPTNLIWLKTDDTIATVLVAGYLSKNLSTLLNQLNIYQMAVVYTTDSGTVLLQVSYANGLWSLASADSGDISLPTVANQLAYATNTAGALGASGITRAFNAGGIDAGLSGTAGTFRSYPATASKGYLALVGVANTGDTAVNISNVAYGQASTISFADVGSAAGRFLVANTATPFTSGNLPVASGTGGLMTDSGIIATNVVSKAASNTMAAGSNIILDKGTVTQGTSTTTTVVLSKQAGAITTFTSTQAAASTVTFTLTNTLIATTSIVSAFLMGGGSNTTIGVNVYATPGSGSATISIENNNVAGSALNGTLVIGFTVF